MRMPADLSKSQLHVYITFSLTQADCCKNLRMFSIGNYDIMSDFRTRPLFLIAGEWSRIGSQQLNSLEY